MSVRLSCPSCNHAFAVSALPAGGRATCTRCGDVFPIRGEWEEVAGDPVPEPFVKEPPPPPKTGWLVPALAVAGLLAAVAGAWIYFAGRSKEAPPPLPPPEPSAAAIPPAQLAALGYLPSNCDVALAAQPGPIIHYAARAGADPRALLAASGVSGPVLAVLDQSGLVLANVEQLAFGAALGTDGGELRLVLALVLKQPPDNEEEFLKKLKARPIPGGKQGRYAVEVERLPLGLLAKVSPTVWVFGLSENDFEAVDRGGYGPGGTQLRGNESAGVRRMVATVPVDAAVWVVADSDTDWAQNPLLKLMARQGDLSKVLPLARGARGGAVAVSYGEQPRVRVAVRAADTATAEKVRGSFRVQTLGQASASVSGEGTLAVYDGPFDPAAGWASVQKLLTEAAR